MTELKPCPFCGARAALTKRPHTPTGTEYTPTCTVPKCAGRLYKKWLDENDAIAAWNRRAEPWRGEEK